MGCAYTLLAVLALWTGGTVDSLVFAAEQSPLAQATHSVRSAVAKGFLGTKILTNASQELSAALGKGLNKENLLEIAEKLSKLTKAVALDEHMRIEMPTYARVLDELGHNDVGEAKKTLATSLRMLSRIPSCQVPLVTPVPGFGESSEPQLMSLRLTGQGLLYSFIRKAASVEPLKARRVYDKPWIPASKLAGTLSVGDSPMIVLGGTMAAVGSATVRTASFLLAGVADVEDYLCTLGELATWLPRLQRHRPWPVQWAEQLAELESLGYLHLEGALRNLSRGVTECGKYLPGGTVCVLFKV